MEEKLRRQYLANMGITQWLPREAIDTTATSPVNSPTVSWEQLQAQVQSCQRCALHKTRKQTVFGVGNTSAELVIVGEAPGANEDQQGLPFVGRAGRLLDEMLQAIELDRTRVYICNVLKCSPPMNRDPNAEEIACCTPYLEQQLALLQPKLILAVGRVAAHYLLGIEQPMHRLRGQRFTFSTLKIPLFVTYHPAYLLRNPKDKAKAYQDLLRTKAFLEHAKKD